MSETETPAEKPKKGGKAKKAEMVVTAQGPVDVVEEHLIPSLAYVPMAYVIRPKGMDTRAVIVSIDQHDMDRAKVTLGDVFRPDGLDLPSVGKLLEHLRTVKTTDGVESRGVVEAVWWDPTTSALCVRLWHEKYPRARDGQPLSVVRRRM